VKNDALLYYHIGRTVFDRAGKRKKYILGTCLMLSPGYTVVMEQKSVATLCREWHEAVMKIRNAGNGGDVDLSRLADMLKSFAHIFERKE